MTLHIPVWAIPTALTVGCLFMLFRPTGEHNWLSDAFTTLVRLLWLIPIGFVWAIYFAVLLWLAD